MKREAADAPSPWRRDLLDEKQAELAALFVRHGVIAAYVFGSLARGRDAARVTPRSDLDLAVLLPAALGAEERAHVGLRIQVELCDLFGRGDIDLVVANDAPLELQHRIVRERDLLYGRHAPERVAFDWRTSRRFLDTEPLRRIRHEAMRRRAREGRFGVRP